MKYIILALTFLLSTGLYADAIMERNLMQDYGSDRYTVELKIQDFYGHYYRAKEHRVDNNELNYSTEGHMGSVTITNDTKGITTHIPHQDWTTFSIYTTKEHNNSYQKIYSCHRKGSRILYSIDTDRKKDMTLRASRLHRWIAYEEPKELLDNRVQVYQIRDLIRQINDAHKKTIGQPHLTLSKVYLENLKKRAIEKIEYLYQMRTSLLEKHTKWQPRKRVWVNMDYFPAKCSLKTYVRS